MKTILFFVALIGTSISLNAQQYTCYGSGTDSLTFVLTSNDATCAGNCEGDAGLTFVAGSGNYDVQWSGPSFSASGTSVSGLCAGTYTLIVSDTVLGITCTNTFVIFEPAPITITQLSQVNPSTGNCDGELNFQLQVDLHPTFLAW